MTALKLDPSRPWKVHASIGGKMIGQYSTAANAELDAWLQPEPCAVVYNRRFDTNDGAVNPPDNAAHRAGYRAMLALETIRATLKNGITQNAISFEDRFEALNLADELLAKYKQEEN
jgi:hypothetical protein